MKKTTMVKHLWLSVLLVFFCAAGHAQNMTSKQAKDLKSRILLVALDESSTNETEKLEKAKKSTDEYKNIIAGNNASIKNAVEKHWKFTTEYKFVPKSEAMQKLKQDPKKYAVLELTRYIDYEHWGGWKMTGTGEPGQQPSSANFNNSLPHYEHTPSQYVNTNEIMEFLLLMPDRVFSVGLPRMVITEADAIYGIKQLQYFFDKLNAEDNSNAMKIIKSCNGNKLKSKTLLLNKEDVDVKLTDDEIKKSYSSKYKLVSQEEIDKAVIDGSDYAIAQIISAEGGKGNVFMQYLVDATTGAVYGIIYPKVAFGIKGVHGFTYNERIKKKQLEEFEDIANCK